MALLDCANIFALLLKGLLVFKFGVVCFGGAYWQSAFLGFLASGFCLFLVDVKDFKVRISGF